MVYVVVVGRSGCNEEKARIVCYKFVGRMKRERGKLKDGDKIRPEMLKRV